MAQKLDTRAIGLDIGLAFSKFLTGKENLHYGLWSPEWDVCAANIGRAQEAYTAKLFELLPSKPIRILDIGGGAGETAKKLLALGHSVDIVIPSAFLAERCRENAPDATVHELMFEDFESDQKFDLCLFSESFQYIPMDASLPKCKSLLAEDGMVIVSDCFRTNAFFDRTDENAIVGGGHGYQDFRDLVAAQNLDVLFDEDITDQVAPSVDVEQEMFNVLGYAISRVDAGLATSRPLLRGALAKITGLFLSQRRRERLDQRLNQKNRSAENFSHFNRYIMMKFRFPKG